MKSLIISHMNSDHILSMRLYLMRHAHLPMRRTKSPQMTDITLGKEMVISSPSSGGRHVIPLQPPMDSVKEAAESLVAMHNECLAALDLSDVVIDRYTPPQGLLEGTLAAVTALVLFTFPFRDQLRPESGTAISQIWSLGGALPGLGRLCYTLQPLVLGVIVPVHAGQAVWFARKRLRRHWVEAGSRVWWCWMLDCCLWGGGCLSRFQRVVKAEEEASKGKH